MTGICERIIIRKACRDDIPRIVQLERECFSNPWPRSVFENDLGASNTLMLCAWLDGELAGYAQMNTFYDEAHVTSLATAPELRRNGIGGMLLGELLGAASSFSLVTLEVRVSNAAAIGMYEKHGFCVAYRRKAYYSDNGEDAFVMDRRRA